MAKFLLLFIGLGAPTEIADDDETTRAYSAKWGQYMGALAQRGALDSGLPLAPSGKRVTREGVTDFELAEVDVYGYLVINADSEEAAVAIAKGAPHIELGGTTIVRPCQEPPA
jgi:hypothetical protein